MAKKHTENFDTKCVHAGMRDFEFLPVVPPIYQTSTFGFESAEQGAALFSGEQKGYIYTRMLNPTIEAFEDCMAELEGGHKSLACASGMAAVNTIFACLTKAGDHVVCSNAVYGPTLTFLKNVMSKFGVETTFVNTYDLNETGNAMRANTKVVFIETPGNPTLSITDIEDSGKIARKYNAKLVVDNTFMSPVLQQPFSFGADIIMHSLTKFLNGHADVVGGVVIVRDEETYREFRKVLNQLGGVIDPFNSFLVHRGIKTLALRMQKHCENAMRIAEYLEDHPQVKWVMYPGLRSHPQYETALKQQKAPGGMISFELKGGFEAGKAMMNSVKLCKLAVSLGGVETLIQHPASMTHFSMGPENRMAGNITEGLVRLSVGIENSDDLIEDLGAALEATKKVN